MTSKTLASLQIISSEPIQNTNHGVYVSREKIKNKSLYNKRNRNVELTIEKCHETKIKTANWLLSKFNITHLHV